MDHKEDGKLTTFRDYEEITLDSNALRQARENFDLLLQKLFRKMEQNDSDEGSITLKVDINMVTEYVPDENGGSHRCGKPVIRHKVTTSVPVKDSFDGKKDTGMELVYDEELKRYVLRYMSIGGQRSIFDEDFQDIVNGTAKEIMEDVPALPSQDTMDDCGDEAYKAENRDLGRDNEENEEFRGESSGNAAWGDTEALDGDIDGYAYED